MKCIRFAGTDFVDGGAKFCEMRVHRDVPPFAVRG